MTRDELLLYLERGLKIEESLLLYTKHIKNTLYLSGFKRDLREKINETLDILDREGKGHEIFLRQLINKLKSGNQDVY